MSDSAGARALRDEQYERQRSSNLRLVGEAERPRERARSDGERRTVVITGQPVAARRRRSNVTTQIQARPDRIALWAVLLGLFLVFMAVATAHASV